MGDTTTEVDPVYLEARIGAVAAREFHGAPDWAKPDLLAWIDRLPSLRDDEFLAECRSTIYDSANCNRFRGNWEHIHCKATACFHEAERRMVAAGHGKDCRGPSLYSRAHAQLMHDHGYTPSPVGECHCDLGGGSDVQ